MYPNFKNKHLEEAIIKADHFGHGRKRYLNKIPSNCIILYHKTPFNYLKRKYKGKYKKIHREFAELGKIYYTNKFCFVLMSGIGSSHAVVLFEDLIAYGVNKFINIGIAGGLDKPGTFVCEKSIRDEGTSHHYIPHKKFAYPDLQLTKKLEDELKMSRISYKKTINWTIDAPLRETKAEVNFYRKAGVGTVEMEASALFTVAKVRKVKIAAAFVVSDILGEDWKHIEHLRSVKVDLNNLVDAAVSALIK
jgi:uridine phosphorylase